jgi:arylsulfatase A-like enzyme
MDAAVGKILAALEAAGLRENTMVIFTTDHGSPFPRAKATLYDAGINTALLMRWPARGLSGGRAYGELLSNVDLFPTVLEACGVETPARIQGRSFLPLLRGGDYRPRDLVFAEKNTTATDVKRCVRTVRHKYIRNCHPGPKLMLSTDAEISLTRRDMGNEHLSPRPEVELYDLNNDPTERKNLAGRPEFAEVEKDLAFRLRAIQEETADPVLAGPLVRPEVEAATIRRAWETARSQCRFRREGLLAGYDVIADPERRWEFAEPRARF